MAIGPIMPKILLINALVAMQLLSWSGRSLYLCLCGTSACFDFGPANCHCCQGDRGGLHRDCDHGPQENGLVLHQKAGYLHPTGDSCDCTHLRISVATMPRVVGEPWPALSKPCELAFADAPLNAFGPGIFSALGLATSSLWLSYDATFLSALSTIVLRC